MLPPVLPRACLLGNGEVATGPSGGDFRHRPQQRPAPETSATEPQGDRQTDQRQTRPKIATDPASDLKTGYSKELTSPGAGEVVGVGGGQNRIVGCN